MRGLTSGVLALLRSLTIAPSSIWDTLSPKGGSAAAVWLRLLTPTSIAHEVSVLHPRSRAFTLMTDLQANYEDTWRTLRSSASLTTLMTMTTFSFELPLTYLWTISMRSHFTLPGVSIPLALDCSHATCPFPIRSVPHHHMDRCSLHHPLLDAEECIPPPTSRCID